MEAHEGNRVKVRYTGRFSDGTSFASTPEDRPLEVSLGNHDIIPGLEDALVGMSEGEAKTVVVQADDAFGPRREDLVISLERNKLPQNIDPRVGQRLRVRAEKGQTLEVTIAGVDEDTVTLDANHPLSGKELTFDVELLEVMS